MRTLHVHVDKSLVGTLSEGNGLWRFHYDPGWAQQPRSFDLSPALPRSQPEHLDGGTRRPVQWYFDNLLPEEGLRLAVAKEAGIKDAQDAFALLTYLGAESAGSLTLLPPGLEMPREFEVRELTNHELSARITNLPQVTLAQRAPKRMSIAGAQHKLLVVLMGDKVYEPVGAAPSTHILKPDHPLPQTYPASAFNEHITMRLAKAARLPVPRVDLRHVPQPVYFIERFDRRVEKPAARSKHPQTPPGVSRLHVIDACQLLDKDRLFKHSGATLDALADIVDKATNKLATRLALFRWLVFNILVGNDDAHLKNLSFYIDHEGIRLAPHYDLLCTGTYHTRAIADEEGRWPEVPMAFALPGARTFGQVTRDAVAAAGERLGLPRAVADRLIREVTTRVEIEFKRIVQEHDELAEQGAPQRAPYLAMEGRLLRIIGHITLKDMLQRLTPPSKP
jgi:serine/threonine-protein kinase HipA